MFFGVDLDRGGGPDSLIDEARAVLKQRAFVDRPLVPSPRDRPRHSLFIAGRTCALPAPRSAPLSNEHT